MRGCWVMLAVVAALLVAGCGSQEPDAPVRLKIGVLPVIDTLPLQVGVRDGLFNGQGLQIELVPFASAHERDVAMQSGEIDGYFGDMLIALLMIDRQTPMRIATVCFSTSKGQRMFGLVAAPGREPAGRLSVGISKSSIIEYLLDRMQARPELAGVELERVEVAKIPIRLQMLLTRQLDSALLPEPLLSLAEASRSKVLITDEDLDMPLTVVCLHQTRLEVLPRFLKAYGQAVERINARPGDYRSLMVETARIPEQLSSTFPVYRFPMPRQPSANEVWQVQQWMIAQGLIQKSGPYESIVARP